MNAFGIRLREERDRLGLSQADFSSLGGVKRNAQAAYEAGTRSPDAGYLTALAAHKVDVLYLLTGHRSAEIGRPSGIFDATEIALLRAARRLGDDDLSALVHVAEAMSRHAA